MPLFRRIWNPTGNENVAFRLGVSRKGISNAVVTKCPDQGQIAINQPGLDRGASVLAGLLLPVTTPMPGAWFEIAGRAKASVAPAPITFAERLNIACSNVAIAGVITGKETGAGSVPT
ncbi:MAG: hypothetical protein F4145_15135 [Boseongicola sp. SB0675_bin_26]|nr:hypothetical protein [Boseongicola sp. SB0675_bin_26]